MMRKRIACLSLMTFILLATSLFVCGQAPQKTRTRPAPQKPRPEPEPTPPDTPQSVETLTVNTNLVMVPVIAMERSGLYLPDLQRDEFSVFEDGVQQNIAFFGKVSEPFHVVLMIDTSASTEAKLRQIQDAALAFVEQLKSLDLVEVISFDDQVRELNTFTSDRAVLNGAIRKTHPGQGTKLYDAFGLALDALRTIRGRRAIVLFTDGVDHYSDQATYEGALRGLDEEGIVVYPIRYNTRADTERLLREQSEELGSQLPTLGVIRTAPPGTTPPTFPSDDPDAVPTAGKRPGGGILGLPSASEILRGRRDRQTQPPADPTTGPGAPGPPTNPDPTTNRLPPGSRPTDPATLPESRSGRDARPDDSFKAMLDPLYATADAFLNSLAEQSGGRLLRADTLASLPDAFARIAAELRTQYSIGYYPKNANHDGLYRKLKVSIARKDVVVRAKPGYRAPTGD